MNIKFGIVIGLLLLSVSFCIGQNYQDSLNIQLQKIADQGITPGFAVSIISDGEVKYMKGFGMADIQSKKAYTPQLIQNIASISKTFIGVALMKAEALGLLNLDDPINKYLPFKIINPRFPNQEISIRHLASHTSSLNDPDDYERAYIFKGQINVDKKSIPKFYKKYIKLYNANKRKPLEDFVKSIYHPEGEYYKTKNFLKVGPGIKYEYSNIGAGIAAWIIEIASGVSFPAFTQKHIFDPIGMNNSSWELDKINMDQKVTPYLAPNSPIPHYDLITFADGGLIASVEDLSKYIIEMMNCYKGKGAVLSQEQCREMMEPYLKNSEVPYGIFWENTKSGLSIGHNGGDPGTMTNMYFQPANDIAKIMFLNLLPTEKKSANQTGEIWKTLGKYELLVK